MRIDSYSLKIKKSFTGAAFQIWLLTSVFLTVFLSLYMFYVQDYVEGLLVFAFFIASFICSAPAFIILMIVVPIINKSPVTYNNKIGRLLVLQLFISIMYGIIAGPIFTFFLPSYKYTHTNVFVAIIGASLILFCCSLLAVLIKPVKVARYFSPAHTLFSYSSVLLQFFNLNNQKTTIMETPAIETAASSSSPSNRILIKGVITGTLILLLLIPAYYITNLVTERQERQKEVVKEVSSKWATEQTLSGPYLVLPYINSYTNDTGKLISVKTNLILFADNLRVNGELIPEKRQRSIYKVLLYKSTLTVSGLFKPQWPVEINTTNIDFAGAKLCFGLSDFKGLEEEIKIMFNNQSYVLSPGLPITDVSEKGLSVPVLLQGNTFNNALSFNFSLKLRGSERLHFLPLAANSKFQIRSAWPNPSFDGNVLPNDREVNNKGFTATWNFNRANLPFNMIEKQGKFNDDNLSFGVSMVQPADQYEKTMRSVKYALLFIGLTFS
ncbi:MAG: inner membrane CreD family protein, partial [Sphingobacteriales bacterium]